MQRSQLGPSKNNAMAIDNQDLGAHPRRTYAVNEAWANELSAEERHCPSRVSKASRFTSVIKSDKSGMVYFRGGKAGRFTYFQADVMDKAQILRRILDRLTAEFEADRATSKMTRAASNDAETKSEGKYDTRSTEENYLADGLAKKAFAAAQAAKAYRDLPCENFGPDQPIDVGALVELSFDGERAWFFLGPAGGGIWIEGGRQFGGG